MKYTKKRRLKNLNDKYNKIRRMKRRSEEGPIKSRSIYWGAVLKNQFESSRKKH